MTGIEDHLTKIKNRMAIGERAAPERLLTDLMEQMGPAELSDWHLDIVRLLESVSKKNVATIFRICLTTQQTVIPGPHPASRIRTSLREFHLLYRKRVCGLPRILNVTFGKLWMICMNTTFFSGRHSIWTA